MPKRDLGSIWELLADLWWGLSPLMRGFGLAGLVLGGSLGLWAVAQVSPHGHVRVGRLLLWVLTACTVAGTVVGLALGAVLEWLGKKR